MGLLNHIRKKYEHIVLNTKTGSAKVKQQGYSEGYGWVWFHEKVLTCIICLKILVFNYQVTYERTDEDSFRVYKHIFFMTMNYFIMTHPIKK